MHIGPSPKKCKKNEFKLEIVSPDSFSFLLPKKKDPWFYLTQIIGNLYIIRVWNPIQ